MHTSTLEAPQLARGPGNDRTYPAAIISAPLTVRVEPVAAQPLGADEVRVRITHCGVCASNVPPWEGRAWFQYPMAPGALGHEAVGVIDELGESARGWNVGDRVAYIGERGYAEMENVPAAALFPLPDDVGDNLFLAEPLACAMNVFRRSGIERGDHVAILGPGFLGILLAQLALAAGANVAVIGRRRAPLAFAEQFGALPVLAENHESAARAIHESSGGKLCDVVIEATGSQRPLDLAAELTRVRGRLVIAGYHQDSPRSINLQLWNWRGLDVINAHERDTAIYLEGMQLAREAMRDGRLTTNGLITHEFSLDELGTALNMAAKRPPGFLKGVIRL
jgi:NADPH:quinone reductase